jgi:proteasome assembly chaperone (PAC2) family protein
MKHEFYYWVNSDEAGNDLVLYTGDAQPILPEGAFRLSEAVVDLAERLGVGTLITVGAFITGRISDNPKVYGAASEADLVKELKSLDVQIIDSGAVTWMNGLIPGLAKVRNLKGLFLSGETSGFMVDPRAAMIILRVLIRKLGLQIEMKELEDQAKEIDDALKKGKDEGTSSAGPGKAKYVG